MKRRWNQLSAFILLLLLNAPSTMVCGKERIANHKTVAPEVIAAEVDTQIYSELKKAGIKTEDRCSDEDFLRRVSLDIAGQLPTPAACNGFRTNTRTDKRSALINNLVDSHEFGINWARYWRDVIYSRATEQRSRFNQDEFTTWMADQWNRGIGWNATVTSMLTAAGNVEQHPETGLIYAQSAMPEDVAAEACRVFLGIQLQCANCHDHPSDIWKRQQFHELAAYFPRIAEKRIPDAKQTFEIISVNSENRRPGEFMHEHPDLFVQSYDRNNDHKLSKEELAAGPKVRRKNNSSMQSMGTMNEMQPGRIPEKQIDRLMAAADTNHDGLLSIDELKNAPRPDNKKKGSLEHHMVDLGNPESAGEIINPKFFVDGSTIPHGLSDEDRRKAIAKSFTSAENPWFARAIVNRVWAEMLGEGFYAPVDDLGPTRSARFPEAMELLCKNFVASGYDPKWLIRAVANTEAYQRKIRPISASEGELPFAAATPVTLRSDVIFNSLLQVFGIHESDMGGKNAKAAKGKPRAILQSPRFLFDAIFGVDPSLPKDEITGTIPQSLLLMNSRVFRAGMSAKGDTQLGQILNAHKDDHSALRELYLLVLAREPSSSEVEICTQYIADVKARPEAFEDLMWSLLNSSEFISRR